MYIGLHVEYLLFLSDFNKTWILLTDFRKNIQVANFMKIRSVGVEFFVCGQGYDEASIRVSQS